MKKDIDMMIGLWREANLPSQERLDQIRLAARKDSTQSVDWWRAVLTVPQTPFLGKVA